MLQVAGEETFDKNSREINLTKMSDISDLFSKEYISRTLALRQTSFNRDIRSERSKRSVETLVNTSSSKTFELISQTIHEFLPYVQFICLLGTAHVAVIDSFYFFTLCACILYAA